MVRQFVIRAVMSVATIANDKHNVSRGRRGQGNVDRGGGMDVLGSWDIDF